MNVLIIGSGARESAFAWKISQSSLCGRLIVAPGNAGTAKWAENFEVAVSDFAGILQIVNQQAIDLVLIGPEAPLVNGLHDFLVHQIPDNPPLIIGPLKQAAMLEGSKHFAKKFMEREQIPTAPYESFTRSEFERAKRYVQAAALPLVIKADGLASGKGVVICKSIEEAENTLHEMMVTGKFNEAAETILIEQFLAGIELSIFVLSDGNSYKILPAAKDYKKVGKGDTGLNTGGMGSVSPVPFANLDFLEKVNTKIILPTLEGLKSKGIIYTGFLFIGLMKVGDEPYVIEYNVRMGDPETQSVLMRIEGDFLALLAATGENRLDSFPLKITDNFAVTVVLCSGGYPEGFDAGYLVRGIDHTKHSELFIGGAVAKGGHIVTNGGRVAALTAAAPTLKEAIERVYEDAAKINFTDIYYRQDIGADLLPQ